MTRSRVVRVRATGVGHVTRRDAECVRDETSGIGPGSSRRRDGVGTRRGTSHNSIPPLKATPQGLGGLVHACPLAPCLENKRQHRGGVGQDSTMLSAAELAAAMAAANDNLVTLVQQQAEVKDQEEQEAKEAAIGSLVSGSDFG